MWQPLAIAWIQVNIARNQTLGCILSNVCAQALLWGDHKALDVYCSFDVILCSDLVYGHGDISQKLVQTIVQLSHPHTLIVSAHEARFAGDRGAAFFSLLSAQHFRVESVPRARLDGVYRATNMHVHLIRPPQPHAD